MDREVLTAEKRVHSVRARASPETFRASNPARQRESLHPASFRACLALVSRLTLREATTTYELSHRFLSGIKTRVTYFWNSYIYTRRSQRIVWDI